MGVFVFLFLFRGVRYLLLVLTQPRRFGERMGMDGWVVTVLVWLDSYCYGYERGCRHGSPDTCILSFLFCLHTFDTSALSEQPSTFLFKNDRYFLISVNESLIKRIEEYLCMHSYSTHSHTQCNETFCTASSTLTGCAAPFSSGVDTSNVGLVGLVGENGSGSVSPFSSPACTDPVLLTAKATASESLSFACDPVLTPLSTESVCACA